MLWYLLTFALGFIAFPLAIYVLGLFDDPAERDAEFWRDYSMRGRDRKLARRALPADPHQQQ